MPIKSPKAKGSAGELEVIHLLTLWGKEVGVPLTLTRNLLQTREGGSDVDGVQGLSIEVKRVEAQAVGTWWLQVCKAAQRTGEVPFLAHRANRKPWRFRVRTTVALHNEYSNAWELFSVDVDMDLLQARTWFQKYLKVFH